MTQVVDRPRARTVARDERSLSEVARHVVIPEGIVSTGWPAVAAVLAVLGVVFDEWQVGLAKLVLAKDRNGLYAADTISVSIPRQVGKTFTFGMVLFALCLIRPGLTVLWTAHRAKTSSETYRAMKGMCQRPELAAHIEATPAGAGDQAIVFRNGSRILFGARERGFGLGFADVDAILFDEAQRLTENAVDDMVPATNQAENPLIVYIGTPPRPIDPGAIFTEQRREALSGDAEGTLFVEMSADPDPDDGSALDLMDRRQWAKANPSYPRRTTERSMLRMWKNLTAASFSREALGRWDKASGVGVMPGWGARRVVTLRGAGRPDEPLVLGLAGSKDGAWGSIGAAVMVDGRAVVGAVERREGHSWIVAEASRIQLETGCEVVLDGGGPLSDLASDLDAAGVRYTELSTDQFLDGCAYVFRAVQDAELSHPGHPDLDAAVKAASWRKVGARRAWSRDAGDISMLEAVTVAAEHARHGSGFQIW